MQARLFETRRSRAWISKRPCAHVLRSDSTGLTLYVNPPGSLGAQPPYRAPYTLAYESDGGDGQLVQYLIAETDSPEAAEALIECIESQVMRIRRSIAGALSSDDRAAATGLVDYGHIHSESTRHAMLTQLQRSASAPLPPSAYEGCVHAVCSSIDAWLGTQRHFRCDWVQSRTLRTCLATPPR